LSVKHVPRDRREDRPRSIYRAHEIDAPVPAGRVGAIIIRRRRCSAGEVLAYIGGVGGRRWIASGRRDKGAPLRK